MDGWMDGCTIKICLEARVASQLKIKIGLEFFLKSANGYFDKFCGN